MTSKNTVHTLSGVHEILPRTGLPRIISCASRMQVLTGFFAILLATGIYMEFFAGQNWNAGEIVLLLHLASGLIFTILFAVWIIGHIQQGLTRSQRRFFTGLSWFLLAKYILVIATGWLMFLPPVLYLGGHIWFWQFETTYILTFLHLWGAIAATLGLFVHLAVRHWKIPARSSCRGEK